MDGAAAGSQRLGDSGRQLSGRGGGRTVHSDLGPGTAVRGLQSVGAPGQSAGQPFPGDRFESHPFIITEPASTVGRMDLEFAQKFAAEWREDWNSHDLERILRTTTRT